MTSQTAEPMDLVHGNLKASEASVLDALAFPTTEPETDLRKSHFQTPYFAKNGKMRPGAGKASAYP